MSPRDLGAPARPAQGRARRFLRGLAKVLAVLAALFGVALAYLLHDLDARVRAAMIEELGVVEARIGRHVTVGNVRVSLGSSSAVVIEDLVVEGATGATGELAEPLLRVPEARVSVALGPLLRSRGRTIAIERLALAGPEITLVRTPEGLSIDDVIAHIKAAPPRKPTDLRVSIQSLAVTLAKLHLLTQGGAGDRLSVDPFTVGASDLRLDAPSHLTVSGTALSASTNVDAAIELSPPAGAPPRTPTTLQRLELHLRSLPIAPVLALAKVDVSRALDLSRAELAVDAVIEPGATIAVRADLRLDKVQLVRPIEGAEPERGELTILTLHADAALDPAKGTLDAKSFELGLGEAKARGKASVRGLGGAVEIDSLELQGSADGASLLALLPPGYRPRPVTIAGPISLSLSGGGSKEQAHGTVKAELAELRTVELDRQGKRAEGKAVSAGLGAELRFTREGGALRVEKLSAHLGELVTEGALDLEGLGGSPSIKALSLTASGPSALLLAALPPSRRPPGVALDGPLTAAAALHGDVSALAGKLSIDLGKVGLRAPGVAKPKGVPLSIEVEGKGARTGATIDRARVRVASIELGAHGAVTSPEQIDLTFDAKGSALGSLIALAPAAALRFAGTTLDGQLVAAGTLRRSAGKTLLEAKATLREARIKRGVVLVTGAPSASLQVEASKGAFTVKADADLGASSLLLAGVFSKPAGKDSRVAFTFTREGEQLRVTDARVIIPGLSVEGLDVSSAPTHLVVKVPATTLSMSALTQAVPLLEGRIPALLADATLRFALELDADPTQLDKAKLHLRSAEVLGSLGQLRGSVDIDGLPMPSAVRFEVTSGDVDLGAAGGQGEPFELPGEDAGKIPVSGRVRLDRLTIRGQSVRALDLDVALDPGRLRVDRLHAEIYSGSLELDKSWIDFSGVPELDLHAKVQGLNLAELPDAPKHELQGRASGSADLHGRGLDLAAITRSLTGVLRVSLREAQGKGQLVHKVTVVNPLLQKVAERMAKKHDPQKVPVRFHQASAAFKLGGGKLTLDEPVLLEADAFRARLQGTIGLDGVAALDGQIDIAAEAIAQGTKGWLVPIRPIPLKIKVFGDAKELKVELIEIVESLAALRGARQNAIDLE